MEQTNIKKTAEKLNEAPRTKSRGIKAESFRSNLFSANGDRIFLIGFMCSGKTISGALLAKRLNLKFKDSDAEIEKIYKKNPSVIIKEQGIKYFRFIEEKTVKGIIKNKNIIVAMGGGIMAIKKWNEYLRDKGLAIYLSCSIEELKKRLLKEENTRPLIGKGSSKEIGKKIKNLLAKRLPYYNKADLKLSVTKLSPDQTAREIEKLIK